MSLASASPTREDFAALLEETYGADEAFDGSVVDDDASVDGVVELELTGVGTGHPPSGCTTTWLAVRADGAVALPAAATSMPTHTSAKLGFVTPRSQ